MMGDRKQGMKGFGKPSPQVAEIRPEELMPLPAPCETAVGETVTVGGWHGDSSIAIWAKA